MALTDQQIQDIADRVIEALHQLAPQPPGAPGWWEPWGAFGSYVAIAAAVVAFVVGSRSLAQQREQLETQRDQITAQTTAAADALGQRQEADDRSEWWRRTQWAIESAASEDETLNAVGMRMIPKMHKSGLASDEDRDLLDTIWQVAPAAADEESAEEFEKRLDEFDEELLLDDSPETGENGITKEAEDAGDEPQ